MKSIDLRIHQLIIMIKDKIKITNGNKLLYK